MSPRAGIRTGWIAPVLVVGLAADLPAQDAKPAPKARPRPSEALWRYESPRGFVLPEPAYGLPTPIKQALVEFIQPVPELTKAYADVFRDKRKFAGWLRGVLLSRRKALAEGEASGPRVLSSDPSKASPGPGRILSTTTVHSRTERERGEIDRYLAVLKMWDPD